MYTKETLKAKLDFINDENNYYAMFNHAYDACIEARAIAHELFSAGVIEDYEFTAICQEIHDAKKKMLQIIREWTAGAIEKSSSKLTRKHIVYSVFNVLFKDLEN